MAATVAEHLPQDIRYNSPICTPKQAAKLAFMPSATVRSWTRPTKDRPAIVHTVGNERKGWPTVPLVGVVETWSMRALRTAGIPMQKLTKVAADLREEMDDPYVLARPVLFTDGIDVYRRDRGDLFRIEDGQQPIEKVIENYLSKVELDSNDVPVSFRVSTKSGLELSIDPRFNAGRLSVTRSRTPVFAVLGALEAGDPPPVVAFDYSLEKEEVSGLEQDRKWLAEIA